jgi:hypothetical protein
MVLTTAERSKRYREKIKQNVNKYEELKEKDRQRKARKQASMTKMERKKYREKHREAQERYRKKLKSNNTNGMPAK